MGWEWEGEGTILTTAGVEGMGNEEVWSKNGNNFQEEQPWKWKAGNGDNFESRFY